MPPQALSGWPQHTQGSLQTALENEELWIHPGAHATARGQPGLSHWTSPKAWVPSLSGLHPSGSLWGLKERISSRPHPPSLFESLAEAHKGLSVLQGGRREHSSHFVPRVQLITQPSAHAQPKLSQRGHSGSGEAVHRAWGGQTTAPATARPSTRRLGGEEPPCALCSPKTRLFVFSPEPGLTEHRHIGFAALTSCLTQAHMFPEPPH